MFPNRVDEISTGLAFALGTLGLPHILMRFLTVPDARAARRSIGWAVGLIGVFYVFVAVIGLGGRAILGDAGVKLGGKSGNLIAPYLAQNLGGGPGSAGGDVFFAVISAIAFTTILAVVAGVVLSAAGAAAHDVYGSVWRKGEASEREEIHAGRVSHRPACARRAPTRCCSLSARGARASRQGRGCSPSWSTTEKEALK